MSMEHDPIDHIPPPEDIPQGSSGNWLPTCLIVGAALFVIMVLLCAGFVWWAMSNAKRLGADIFRNVAVQAVNESEMSAQDKREVIAQIDRVTRAYKDGDIDLEDMSKIMEELVESPLILITLVAGAEEAYIKNSDLTDEEKAAASITLQRVARGVFEEKISNSDVEPLLDHISTKNGNQRQMKQPEQVSAEDLRAMLTDAKQLADDAEIPDEPFEVDIGAEFKKAVDRALAK